MTDIFLQLLNMSISAGWLILVVLVLRLFLKNAPRWITVCLWGMVAIRLICPFSPESAISLIPNAQTVSPGIATDALPQVNTGIPVLNDAVNPIISGTFSPEPTASVNPLQIWLPIGALTWLAGSAALLLHTGISYLRLKKRVSTAVLLKDNIFQSEAVTSPFVFGIIRPRIYLPFHSPEARSEYVLAHEQAHIRRKDHIWKPMGFLLLALHWFNPLVWLGYNLLCRDIELACDEKVIRKMNKGQKADYAQALLNCSVNRPGLRACPLAFGEVGVKNRVKLVLCYKKPVFWVILAAGLIAVATAACFLTDPISLGENHLLMQVLDNEKAFVSQTGTTIYLKDYTLGGGAKIATAPQKYAFVDMDGDGADEMILYASPDYGAYLVFRARKGQIYCYEFEERQLSQLKKDGSFLQIEGSGINRYMSLRFDKTGYSLTEQAYKNDTVQRYDPNGYQIGGKAVSPQVMYDFAQNFDKKSAPQWYSYRETGKTDVISLYMDFLDGKRLTRESLYIRQPIDAYWNNSQYFGCAYTFYDLTGDGIPELLFRDYSTFTMHIFTVKNGQIHRWYSSDSIGNLSLLNNGALMRTTSDSGYQIHEYFLLDPNASVIFRITFAWYDGNSNLIFDGEDRYVVNGEEVPKAEFDQIDELYGDIGTGMIQWNYKSRYNSTQEPTLG